MLVNIIGGLGNQMFCYAFALAMRERGYEVLLNASGHKAKKNWRLEITNFHLSLPLTRDFKSIQRYLIKHDKLLPLKFICSKCSYALRGIPSFRPSGFTLYKHAYFENDGLSENEVLRAFQSDGFHPHALPLGYFQNLVYFEGIESAIKRDFTPKTPLSVHNLALKERIAATPQSISLHIRLGDYLIDGTFTRLGSGYYNHALRIMREKLRERFGANATSAHIFVFSNDIAWCEENLPKFVDFSGFGVEFIKGNAESNAYEEMALMRACQHNIIANSTFSWWAAYLNDNPHKIVIMPRHFISDTRRIPRYGDLNFKDSIALCHTWIPLAESR